MNTDWRGIFDELRSNSFRLRRCKSVLSQLYIEERNSQEAQGEFVGLCSLVDLLPFR